MAVSADQEFSHFLLAHHKNPLLDTVLKTTVYVYPTFTCHFWYITIIIIIIALASPLYKIQYTGNPPLTINASVLLYFLWLGNLNSTISLQSTTSMNQHFTLYILRKIMLHIRNIPMFISRNDLCASVYDVRFFPYEGTKTVGKTVLFPIGTMCDNDPFYYRVNRPF